MDKIKTSCSHSPFPLLIFFLTRIFFQKLGANIVTAIYDRSFWTSLRRSNIDVLGVSQRFHSRFQCPQRRSEASFFAGKTALNFISLFSYPKNVTIKKPNFFLYTLTGVSGQSTSLTPTLSVTPSSMSTLPISSKDISTTTTSATAASTEVISSTPSGPSTSASVTATNPTSEATTEAPTTTEAPSSSKSKPPH